MKSLDVILRMGRRIYDSSKTILFIITVLGIIGIYNFTYAGGPLSNTPVTQGQVGTYFHTSGPGLIAFKDGNALGVHSFTRVWQGRSHTTAEGLYLSDFSLEKYNDTVVRDFAVSFLPVVRFDFNGGTENVTSWYCSNCTISPVPVPPASSDLTNDIVSFQFPAGIDPFSANLYLISDSPPKESSAAITLSNVGGGGGRCCIMKLC